MGITENGALESFSLQCITVQTWRVWVPSQIGIRRRMPRSAVCLPIATSTDAAYRARALYHPLFYMRQRVSSAAFRHAHAESPWPWAVPWHKDSAMQNRKHLASAACFRTDAGLFLTCGYAVAYALLECRLMFVGSS
jgi:hypothetical protein